MFAPSIAGRVCTCAQHPHTERLSFDAASGLRPLTSAERCRASVRGFTLFELMIVMGIVALLMVLIAPAFTTIKSGTDVTSAAYTVKSVLDTARTYAQANNTYTWVGFFEEDVSQPSKNPAPNGIGRLVMSIVASEDGTMIYSGNLSSPVTLDPANSTTLIQVGKLTKIDNMHPKTFPTPTATPPPSDTFNTRPAVSSTASQIGNDATDPSTPTAPPNPSITFHYPVGSSSPQYTFVKVVQFSPRGEAVVDNSNYTLATVSEIGLEPTHGNVVPSSTPANLVAVQFAGDSGNVRIYRK